MKSSKGEDLAAKSCIPCRGGVPPLRGAELARLREQLDSGWEVVREHHIEKTFPFPDFRSALDFTVRLGQVAEKEGHHPDIYLSWGRVRLEIWTHKIDGLTESDFILAAKADTLY
jgi:4a-hydroxytetrahydrobiopterin dehydratase